MSPQTQPRVRDERGSTLLFALVMIIVVSVAGVAVLNQLSSAPAVQNAYAGSRTVTLKTELTSESLVNRLRGDSSAGIDSTTLATTCNDRTQFKQLGTSNIFCEPDRNSGLQAGVGPDVPPFTIMALGGSYYTGNRQAVSGLTNPPYPTTSVTGWSSTGTAPYWYPFCDNFHDFQDGSNGRCEAALFVGRNVTTDSLGTGGLTIETNGTTATGPLVRSNGAIVLSNANGSLHTLNVSGGVQARRMCGWGSDFLDTTGLVDGPGNTAGPAEITATSLQCNSDYRNGSGAAIAPNAWTPNAASWNFAPDPVPPTTMAAAPTPTACQDDPPVGPGLVTANCMWPDPDWTHEPIDFSKVPRVDASAPAPYKLDSSLCGTTPGAKTVNFVVMPAAQAYDQTSPGGTTPLSIPWTDVHGTPHSTPMYTAWYDNADDLNAFTGNCPDTVFWFRPGVYYFDFLDVKSGLTQDPTSWSVPMGCIPSTACGTGASQVVGGYNDVYSANGVTAGWVPCGHGGDPYAQPVWDPDIKNCQQPWKPLEPHKITNAQGAGFAAADTAGQQETLDGTSESIKLSGSFQNDSVKSDQFQSPIPQTPNVDISHVDGVSLELGYSLPNYNPSNPNDGTSCGNSSTLSCYKDPSAGTGDNDGTANTTGQGPGADIQFQIGGTGAGSCFIHLPPGDHSVLNPSYPNAGSTIWHAPAYPNASYPESTLGAPKTETDTNYSSMYPDPVTGATKGDAINIDLTNGCNANVPGFEQVTNPCLTLTSNNCFPTAASGWNAHPEWVNFLHAEMFVRTDSSTSTTPGATVSFDGMQMNAKWTGRPAPAFPDGCDTSGPGTQWIFGGSSRIDWSTGTDTYAEMCANKQSSWPGVSGSGSNYGVGIYGVSEDSAGPPPVWFSNKVDPAKVSPLSNSSGDFYWPQYLNPAAYTKIDATESNAAATAAGPPDIAAGKSIGMEWSKKNNLVLNYQLPSNYWTWNGTSYRPSNSFECGITAPLASTDTHDPPQVGSEIPNDGSCGPNTIPFGSTITDVTLKIHHREGRWSAGCTGGATSCVPTSGNFSNCATNTFDGTSCIDHVRVSINPGPGLPQTPNTYGSGATGSNGLQNNSWSLLQQSGAALNSNSVPISTASTASLAAGGDPTGYSLNHDGWRNWAWGIKSPNTTASVAAGNPATSDWSLQKDLTASGLNSPEALAGAVITYEVDPKDDSTWHYAELDGIELQVTYRPAGSLRPLAGCVGLRSAWSPATLEGLGTAPGATVGWNWDPTLNGGSGGWSGTYNGGGHDWLDQDWGVFKTTSGTPWTGDDPMGNLSDGSPGNGTGDRTGCALINLDSSKTHTRLHIVGTIYAPSAGVALSAYQNDGPWVTDGILARELSALRWKKDAGDPSVGDGGNVHAKYPRTVTIIACDPNQTWTSVCTGSDIKVRAKVQFDDELGMKYGFAVNVLSWIRNPPP
jgi:hypothetical protein